jgi:hypothetical protein
VLSGTGGGLDAWLSGVAFCLGLQWVQRWFDNPDRLTKKRPQDFTGQAIDHGQTDRGMVVVVVKIYDGKTGLNLFVDGSK